MTAEIIEILYNGTNNKRIFLVIRIPSLGAYFFI